MNKKLSEVEVRSRFLDLVAMYPTQRAFAEAYGVTESYISKLIKETWRGIPVEFLEDMGINRSEKRFFEYTNKGETHE